MHSVTLDRADWQAIINILATAKEQWVVTNPLLTKLTQQLQQPAPQDLKAHSGNSHDELSDRPA